MKLHKFLPLILISAILSRCGKPNDPESFFTSGGYTIVKHFQTPANAQDITLMDTLCFIAQGEGGLLVVNVKDPLDPKIVSITTENVRGYSRRIVRKDNFVYLAAGTFGYTVADISNPYQPSVTASNLNMKPAKDALIDGNYMYCAISEQGVNIAELSVPGYPDIRGNIFTNGYANGVAVSADKTMLFVACGEMGISIYDISVFDDGYGAYPLLAWYDTPGYAEAVVLNEDKKVALVAAGSAGLLIIDYSDVTHLKTKSVYSSGGSAYDLICKGNIVYLSAQRGGFHIIDISDVSNPEVIGRLYMKQSMGFDMNDKYIYVADTNDGLVIISIPE